MQLSVEVENTTYEFAALTEEELLSGTFLYNSTKPSDVNKLKKMVFEKYIGTEGERLKLQLDKTPRLFHQIFEQMSALTGQWFFADVVELSKEDLAVLEEKKIPSHRVVKIKLFPEHIDGIVDENIPSEEECCVLFKRLNQVEFDAIRLDVSRDSSKAFDIIAKTGKDFCIEKKKADHLASIYPSYYLIAGTVINNCATANVKISVGKY